MYTCCVLQIFPFKIVPAKALSKPHFFSASHARALIIARAKEERNVLKKCLKERAPRGERSPRGGRR